MKPQLLKVQTRADYSFSVREDIYPYFYDKWHYHQEYELIYIEKGFGTQFIGDSIKPFKEGDVLLVGSNLPHYWRCDDVYFQDSSNLTVKAIVVHFKEDFWGRDFLNLPENLLVKEMLETSKRGLHVTGKTGAEVAEILKNILDAEGSEKIILLLKALFSIAKNTTHNQVLSSSGFTPLFDIKESERLNRIYTFTYNNFRRKISLNEVAGQACMSTHSFCRYFKTHTHKTYSEFLQDVRIGYACKLLIENKLSLAQVCYNSGFNNFTNFYKYFKLITGKTPQQYQKLHTRKVIFT
ncbi:AraC family transcriptional regulator [Lacibacter sp.]|uniref:AraC family transcriptional regulator n=1 Tax=Lacibacter sp. TaxID=1915409 RepID=UPI002B4B3D5D|nr:helix-turn-helix domain-containing protein [Lacibacter sp.]HLP38177.1 helix-turn-helix domain-containing protein [Lacibacter sp.]